jgi:hypothetical protein
MVKFMFGTIFCCTILQVNAQQYNKSIGNKSSRFKYYFNGGVGYCLPGNGKDVLAKKGSYTSFSFQINYKENIFLRTFFDIVNINYEKATTVNNINTLIKDKLNANFIGLDSGYNKSIGKFTPAIFIGGGLVTMDVPQLNFDVPNNSINFDTKRKRFFGFRTGLNLDYEINKLFILYIEGNFLSIPYKTEIDNQLLNGIVLQIGFKTPLK